MQPDYDTETGYWILGLGAALFVAAGSYAALRRKQASARDITQPETMYGYKPVVEQERGVEPFVAVNPADRFNSAKPEPVEAPVMLASAVPVRSAAALAPKATGDLVSRREAMIAEAPSAANPFLTRKNRLRRANFLLAQSADELVLEHPASPGVAEPNAEAKPASTVQISYAFGKNSLRPPLLKPRYN